MDTNKTELNMKELEMANGGGLYTRFDTKLLPSRKRQTNETGNERNDH